jgi:hypothetical protein
MAALTTIDIATVLGAPDLDGDLVAAASGGDTAEVGDGVFLLALNSSGDASDRTITIATPGTVDGHAVADATLVIDDGDYGIIPLTGLFRGTTGRASITYSDSAADITVAVYKLGK